MQTQVNRNMQVSIMPCCLGMALLESAWQSLILLVLAPACHPSSHQPPTSIVESTECVTLQCYRMFARWMDFWWGYDVIHNYLLTGRFTWYVPSLTNISGE